MTVRLTCHPGAATPRTAQFCRPPLTRCCCEGIYSVRVTEICPELTAWAFSSMTRECPQGTAEASLRKMKSHLGTAAAAMPECQPFLAAWPADSRPARPVPHGRSQFLALSLLMPIASSFCCLVEPGPIQVFFNLAAPSPEAGQALRCGRPLKRAPEVRNV